MGKMRRRKAIVDNLQYRLMLLGIGYFTIVCVIFAAGVFVPVLLEFGDGTVSTYQVQLAAKHFLSLQERVWPPMAVALAILVIHSIVVSHRIAGPLVRLRAVLTGVGEGDLSSVVRLRRHDYLYKEERCVNEMIGALSAKIKELQSIARTAAGEAGELERVLQAGSNVEASMAAGRLATNIRDLTDSLGEFRVRSEATEADAAAASELLESSTAPVGTAT